MSAQASPPSSPGASPRIAAIVPAYGVAHLVGEALASLQAQTLTDWECVVIDDGAPDDVAAAVAPYLADPRIRFLATANGGVSTARNRAIAETGAPLIALLDGDDLFRPTYLETMVAVLESDPEVRLATCNARIFGAVSRERTCVETRQGSGDGIHGSLSDVLDRSFNVYIGTTFRRADFDAIGGFDTAMAQSEDFDLWVRLMLRGGVAYYVDEVLGDYRVRPGSASSNAGRMLLGNIKVYEKARATFPEASPERDLIDRLLADNRASLSFEHAMDRIIDGDTRKGLAELRDIVRAGGMVGGPVWKAAFTLWQVVPILARPMLRWRRRAHSRGRDAAVGMFPGFLEIEG
ncbi:glycosyltransferase family A protein [Novosphingobium sp. MMS21-SN21R]|uniref:glycosyltransferase family A protein n=1 Tax=Novosphingobium sp. MMS21-SN21R TaxID=2969298 RepID=UPI0028850772|nr:glycosyltransferase family A protein [Novosphingobium sp. MMS21-SN21R]MDT0508952.1 glycosyltransferase family A protein [Novosphingobium sp. MMS21-SN21R]